MLPQRVGEQKNSLVKKEHMVFDLDATLLHPDTVREDFFNEPLVALYIINQHRIDRIFFATHRCRDVMADFYPNNLVRQVKLVNEYFQTNRTPNNYKTSFAKTNLEKIAGKKITAITGDDYSDLSGAEPLPVTKLTGSQRLGEFEAKEFDPSVYNANPDYRDDPLWNEAGDNKDWQYLAIGFDILDRAIELDQKQTDDQSHVLHVFEDGEDICFDALLLAKSPFWPKKVELKIYQVDAEKRIFQLMLDGDKLTTKEIPIEDIIKQLPQTEVELEKQLQRVKDIQHANAMKREAVAEQLVKCNLYKSEEERRQQRFQMHVDSIKLQKKVKKDYLKAYNLNAKLKHQQKLQQDLKKQCFSLWHKNSKMAKQEREQSEFRKAQR